MSLFHCRKTLSSIHCTEICSKLTLELKSVVEGLKTDTDKTLETVTKIATSSSKVELELGQIPSIVDLVANTSSAVARFEDRKASDHDQVLSAIERTSMHVQTLVGKWEDLEPTVWY